MAINCLAQYNKYRAVLKDLSILNLQWLGFKLENDGILETEVSSDSISFYPFTLKKETDQPRVRAMSKVHPNSIYQYNIPY